MRRLIALFALILTTGLAHAESDFYKGKKIRFIVSSTPGGGNDTYTRLIARHISKHIPGNPTIVVQNMPGAGGLLAAQYLGQKARRDGTVVEQVNWGVWNYQVIKDPRANFDFSKMHAIGVAVIENTIIYARKDRFKSMDDIRKSGRLATVGATGRQSSGYTLSKIIEKITGEKFFDVVLGYPGARQYSLALRQGELDAGSLTVGSFFDQMGDVYEKGDLAILAQAGTMDRERDPLFPNVPTLDELAKDDKGRQVAKSMTLLSHYGRPYVLPPGVPADRVKILREAFWKTMHDPAFLAEAKKLRRPIEPVRGEKLQEMWQEAFEAPPEDVELIREIFTGKKS